MSSKNNVNPGQYKTRGSQRQGEDVVHDIEKKEFKQTSAPDQDEMQTSNTKGQSSGSAKDKKKTGQKTAKSSGR